MGSLQTVTRSMVWALLLVTHVVFAQTDIKSLDGLLKGQQKALLNFSGDPVARFRWQGGKLEPELPAVRTLAIFIPNTIFEQGNVVVLAGTRATLLFDSKQQKYGLSVREPMRLEIDLTGTSLSDALPKLPALLFFPSVREAVAGVPKELADRIPYDVSSRKDPKQLGQLAYREDEWRRLNFNDPRYKPPTVVVAPEPQFTDEARQRHYSGAETLFVEISEAGKESNLWVADPLDYGLDAQSVAAVRKYIFKPATLDGQPTKTLLGVEVHFTIQ